MPCTEGSRKLVYVGATGLQKTEERARVGKGYFTHSVSFLDFLRFQTRQLSSTERDVCI